MKIRILIAGLAAAFAMTAAGAQQPDRHQVQPRRRGRHAEGQGRRALQGAGRRSAPRAASRSRSIRTARCTRTRKNWRRCSWARCRCWRRRSAKFGPLGVKEFEVFDLPYMFDNSDVLHSVTEGPVGKALLKKLEPQGHHRPGLLGQRLQGHDAPTSRCITPADFKGLKMRIQSSKVLDAQMRALGANPQVMAFSEVYQALQTGVVDGTENPPSNFYTQKMHEVQKYVTRVRPRLPRLCGDREQEVLGRPAGGHPHRRWKAR